MTTRKNVLITGAIASAVIGGAATFFTHIGPPSTVLWTFFGVVAALSLHHLITLIGDRTIRGRRYIHALAIGNVIGGLVVACIPTPQPPLQLALGLAAALAGFVALRQWTANAGQAENNRQRRNLDVEYIGRLSEHEREMMYGLSTVYRESADHRAPILTTLWMNNQFIDIYTPITTPRRVPFIDISHRPTSIEDWRDLVLITRALQARDPRQLRNDLNRVAALPRHLHLSARVLTAAGREAGLDLLESDMPDEYLKAMATTK